ncbi:MAG: galactose-1-phosphate uridylyltransferase [Acidilobus sp.]
MRELRYNPLTGQWIMVSSVRAQRRWRPQGYCPFCPGAEETGYGWDVLVLPNRYAVLSKDSENVMGGEPPLRRAQAYGECGVIIETPEHNIKDLDELSTEQVSKVIRLWRDVTEREMADRRIIYIMIFRNKGEEMGVSLTHPHGQYYAMPFLPLRPRLIADNARKYYRRFNRCVFCDILEDELKIKERVVYSNRGFVAFLPYYASWPFELHVYPRRHVQYITELNDDEIVLFADAVRASTGSLNALFSRQMPYTFNLFQAPLRGSWPFLHMHLEIYPILRDRDKLKYAAGIEMSTWDFTYDSVPEENASLLREACNKVASKLGLAGTCGP